MSEKTPVPLLGRLALQTKLITADQLKSALRAHKGTGGAPLGDVMIELGLLNPKQLKKLEGLQRDVIARHRAKRAAAQNPDVIDAASHAAQSASPMRSEDVADLSKPPDAVASAPPVAAAATAAAPVPAPAAPAPSEPEPALELEPAPETPLETEASEAAAPEAGPIVPPVEPPVAPPAPVARAARDVAETEPADAGLDLGLAEATPEAREKLEQLLGQAVRAGASDVHIHAQGMLKWRVGGELIDQGPSPLSQQEAETLVSAALTRDERALISRTGELDYCLDLPGIGRFRANSYRQQRGFDSVYRVVSAEPPTLESLGLPSELARFTKYHQGMVLVTGPAGCGKSATMAALVNLINEERNDHILCIEDPIEIIHPSKNCLVNQRHAGRHTESFARALRGALREDPDVIVIGELRDLETISLAMTAAETGHFVLATLHTNNAVRTINRMIGAFPSNQQAQVRAMLSESLRAVISQRLVPTADGSSRIPALELLVLNKAISNLVRDEKTVQVRSAIQTGGAHGMYLLEQSLNQLAKDGHITVDTALKYAEDHKLITAS